MSENEFIVREIGYPGAIKQEVIGELVRCEDCYFYEEKDRYCGRHGLWGAFDPNDYCSHAERNKE